ncbi:MAG: hypothetical protein JST00_33830 [Deltaproteobacteria bacterium]|nr:hypothetical protein [Deltaproteobacteria bacterium]
MRSFAALLVSTFAAVALAACSSQEAGDEEESDPGLSEGAVSSLDPDGAQPVAITDPSVLRELEQRGYGFGHHFGVADDARGDVLQTTAGWSSITHGISANLEALQRADGALNVGMAYAHRLFDKAWMRSNRTRYALVAVTNRLDRSKEGDCGEVRFVYRMEYDDPREGATSRMPMTIAVVVPQKMRSGEATCAGVAQRWQSLTGRTGSSLVGAATAGPLAQLPKATSVETNLQAVRWPSSVRPDLGGHAEYMLNVWEPGEGGGYESAPLENTPDVAAIKADPAKKAALVGWMKTNLFAIDKGTAKLPASLAARTAYSYGPRGLSRLANRPYSVVLDAPDLAGLAFQGTQIVKSAEGLLRRLDQQSCQGCHQARGMAGFHVLGNEDDAGTNNRLNRLAVGTSPHFNEEIAWRTRLLRAAAEGKDPSKPSESRPIAEHATNDGLVGQSCALTSDPSFASWSCREGLACKDMIGDGVIGTCQPAGAPGAGDACEKDKITFSSDPRLDKIQNLDTGDAACRKWRADASCSGASGGFPGGACAAPCSQMGLIKGDGICGPAPPAKFNECMAGRQKSFEECMSPPRLSFRKLCNVQFPCRDDYVCAYVPGAPKNNGACMPPYFIFQARVDGHE